MMVIPIIRCNDVSLCNLSIEVKLVALRQSPTKLCIKQGSIHLPWMCVFASWHGDETMFVCFFLSFFLFSGSSFPLLIDGNTSARPHHPSHELPELDAWLGKNPVLTTGRFGVRPLCRASRCFKWQTEVPIWYLFIYTHNISVYHFPLSSWMAPFYPGIRCQWSYAFTSC